jgi:hypothetical protein
VPQRQIARATITRRRVAARMSALRRTRAAAFVQNGGQNSTFQEPVFQSAPNFQSQPRIRSRYAKGTARNPNSGFAQTYAQ